MESIIVKTSKSKLLKEVDVILTVYFPRVKFEVSSKIKDTKIEVTVAYTDGVTALRVKNALKHVERPSCPKGIKIIVERTMSDRAKNLIMNETKSIFKIDKMPDENDYFEPMEGSLRKYIDSIFRIREFQY